MNKINIVLKFLLTAGFVVLLANCAATGTYETAPIVEEKVVVTGSRILRIQGIESRAPVTDLGQERIRITRLDQQQLFARTNQIFKKYKVNPTIETKSNSKSTFAMDVDSGSYRLAAEMLRQGQLPNVDGIRIEEFINAMNYHYHQSRDIFSISSQAIPSPTRPGYHLLHIGITTPAISSTERLPANIVLVADVSGSMASDNKIELLKRSFESLVSQLNSQDKIAIVTYSDRASLVLPPTQVTNKRKIISVLSNLVAGGSTNAEQGINLAYQVANQMYHVGMNNRVVLTSDGMANVGSTSAGSILENISASREKGIFLTTVGVGVGMYNDYLLEQLADKGNGNYIYVANERDIQQSFIDGLESQLQVVAKDARIQVNFNPKYISHYRLLGYENRHMDNTDFKNANKDAGEIGAGHKVTALYEVKLRSNRHSQPLGEISIAYKKPFGKKLRIIKKTIPQKIVANSIKMAAPDTKLSAAAASFAEKLRQSYWSSFYQYKDIEDLLVSLPNDYVKDEKVQELMELIRIAKNIDNREPNYETDQFIRSISFDRVPLLD